MYQLNESIMKNYLLLAVLIILVLPLSAQESNPADTSYWAKGGVGSITFSQVSLTNWAAGGENSVSLNGFLGLFSNYKKDRTIWENRAAFGYGLIKQGEADFSKSDDRINLSTQFGYKLNKDQGNWYFSSLLDFKTQFAEGVDADGNVISEFMAPGYLLLATGVDYKVKDIFSFSFAPVTGKFTFVADDALAAAGAYGVDPGKNSRAELGTFVRLLYKNEIATNVNYETRLELFTNYLENFGNIDVNWENLLFLKINKYLTANLQTQLLYDDDIDIGVDTNDDDVLDEFSPRIQFKSVFGLGLTYNFGAKDE